MTIQLSTLIRNAMLDVIETTTGASPKLRIYTGSQPTNCAAARSGALLCEISLPADWMGAASGGTKSLAGTWTGTAATTGTPGHYAVMDSAGSVCHEQGSTTAAGGGGDLILDSMSITAGQTVTITAKALTAPNA